MRFAYYPGCSPRSTTRELDMVTRRTASALGISLMDMEGAACCGSVELRLNDPDFFYALNARTLAMAEEYGLDLLTVCNTCQLALSQANQHLKSDDALLDRTNRVLSAIGLQYRGTANIKHYLWVLLEDIGAENLGKKIRTPLSGLKVAPFYGCHLLRPMDLLGFDDPDEPNSLERFIDVCGADPVDFRGKVACCGFHNLPYDQRLAVSLTGKYLREAKNAGADCMVTPCPLCFTMLDGYQEDAERGSAPVDLPVFHLPQLLGLALGMGKEELMLNKHMVSPSRTLEKIAKS